MIEVEDKTLMGKWLASALGVGTLVGSLFFLGRKNQQEEWRRAQYAVKAQVLQRVTKGWRMRTDDSDVRRETANLARLWR